MSKASARKEKGERSRISRAIRLIRRGAISKAGKALESKGMGDLSDVRIWEQINAKHLDMNGGYRRRHGRTHRRRNCK